MLIWLVAAVLFFIVEAVVPGLVSVWFGMAAVVTMLVSPFIKNFLYEFYIFIILSGILFFFTRKIAKSWKEKRKDKLDRIRGTVVEVKSINDKGLYEIYLDGKNWTGKSSDSLEVGEKVQVVDIEGIRLVLKNLKNRIKFLYRGL